MRFEYAISKSREFSGHRGAIYTICPSFVEGHLLSAGSDGHIVSWNLQSGEGTSLAHLPSPVYSLLADKNSGRIVAGTQSGGLYFLDTGKGKELFATNPFSAAQFDLILQTDKNELVACDQKGNLLFYDFENPALKSAVNLSAASIRTLILSGRADFPLLAGGSDGEIRLLNPEKKINKSLKAHSLSVFRLCLAPDGRYLLSVGRDAHLKGWHLDSAGELPAEIVSLPAHLGAIYDLIFHSDGIHFFTASMDKSIRMWKYPEMELVKVADYARHGCHRNGVNRICWMNDRLYSCGDDGKVMEWQVEINPC